MTALWKWDPGQRKRHGGSAAEYAFAPSLDVFVREVVQNSKDQARTACRAAVRFNLFRLEGEELKAFLEAVHWEQLKMHLHGAGASEHFLKVRQSLSRLEKRQSLLLLRVDDLGTGGLVGGDFEQDSSFVSLCVDELFSNKPGEGAGGSYGLGKSVLWRFSEFSTVLFSSVPSELRSDQSGLRIFGRAQLPWHQVESSDYDGTGWFGIAGKDERNQETAVSLWSPESESVASSLFLDRPREPGTSILILGFRPPAADRALDDQSLCSELCRAASLHFWPVIGGDTPTLEVSARLFRGREASPKHEELASITDEVQPFVECARAGDGVTAEHPENPGDIAARDLEISIPATQQGKAATKGTVRVVLRVSHRITAKKLPTVNQVAMYRGFGMIVKYRRLENLSLSARPYHAILQCGEAHGDDPSDKAVEDFLRCAEPPEHNNWESTPRLRNHYKQGYAKALTQLDKDVRNAVRELVSEAGAAGEEGPVLLSKMFPIGRDGATTRHHRFSISGRTAVLGADGRWNFSAEVGSRDELESDWEVLVGLGFSNDDGGHDESVVGEIEAIEGATISVTEGVGRIRLGREVKRVRFRGRSDPSLHPVAVESSAVVLDVTATPVGEQR